MRRPSAIAAGACNDRIRICALGRILGGHRRAALDDVAFRGRGNLKRRITIALPRNGRIKSVIVTVAARGIGAACACEVGVLGDSMRHRQPGAGRRVGLAADDSMNSDRSMRPMPQHRVRARRAGAGAVFKLPWSETTELHSTKLNHRRAPWKIKGAVEVTGHAGNGRPGSTSIGCWSPSAASRRPKPRQTTIVNSPSRPCRSDPATNPRTIHPLRIASTLSRIRWPAIEKRGGMLGSALMPNQPAASISSSCGTISPATHCAV